MTENSYINMNILSDSAIEETIGHFIRSHRKRKNKTQAELASEAGISRSTLSLLERGESVHTRTLIQVLRVLDQLQVLAVFHYEEPLSPMLLAEMQHRPKQRIRKRTKK